MFKGYKLKLSKNKSITNDASPDYVLTYKADPKNASCKSHAILSAFVQNNDVVIDLDEDLFNEAKSKKNYIKKFFDDIGSLNLHTKYTVSPSTKRPALLGILVESRKKKEAERVTVYVPHEIWVREEFKTVLPPCGARYYIVNGQMEQDIVEQIPRMTEKEKVETFHSSIFDLASYGQMGIISNSFSYEALTRILGLEV